MKSDSGHGKLWGIGLGPGDPELVTVKAARIIGAADVIAFHSARHGRSISRAIAAPYMRPGQLEEHLIYPVTTETTDHPAGYQGAIDEFYEQAAARLAAHLEAGRTVALLAAGDPLFYSSYMHMHRRLADRFDAEIIPGITSVSAASAALGTPLVEGDQVLTVLPGTLPADELARRLAGTGAAAIMKLGRTFPAVRQALSEAGRLDDAYYVERASTGRQRVLRAADVADDDVPYFAITVVPGPRVTTEIPLTAAASDAGISEARSGLPASNTSRTASADSAIDPVAPSGDSRPVGGASPAAPHVDLRPADITEQVAEQSNPSTNGEVVVVGLGPGSPEWTTPEVTRALAGATDLVGYTTYIAGFRCARASGGTPATTGWNPNAPPWHWIWPDRAPGWWSSPPVIRAYSPWPRRSSRSPPLRSGARSWSACCPA